MNKKYLMGLFLIILTLSLLSCTSAPTVSNQTLPETGLQVHFIDVGQADSILISSNGSHMLIDAGNNTDGDLVVNYLRAQNIAKLDYIIGTHPHEDHIGGLDDVIHSFEIDTIIMPNKIAATQTFEDVLDAIDQKGLRITAPVPGDIYSLGNSSFTILSPVKEYGEDANNWSVGIKLTYEENSFVMCGDVEAEAEKDICETALDLSADVLKLAHHGSSTSTTDTFLEAVNPSFAVISCETGNSYGHPHKEITNKMKQHGVQVYRTDEQGTLIASSNGTEIIWNQESGNTDFTEPDKPISSVKESYVLNKNTKKFHTPVCASVSKIQEQNKELFCGTKDELIQTGYEPCNNCKP